MTSPAPVPAPQSAYPLDYWLSPELAAISPAGAPSRLRQLADAQGTVAAGWSSAIAGGPVLALAGAFFSTVSGNPAAVLALAPLGVVLMLLGLSRWKRVRASLPNTQRILVSRGPGSARGGIVMVSFLAAVLGGILFLYLPSAAAKGGATAATLTGSFVLMLLLLVACIVVPSAVMGRARQSFRQRVQADPALHRAVEEDLAVWRDPYGNAGYGPL